MIAQTSRPATFPRNIQSSSVAWQARRKQNFIGLAYWHLYASACGVVNSSIQRRLLAEQSLTFKQAHDLARAMETAEKNVKDMQKPSPTNTALHMVTHTEGSAPPGEIF